MTFFSPSFFGTNQWSNVNPPKRRSSEDFLRGDFQELLGAVRKARVGGVLASSGGVPGGPGGVLGVWFVWMFFVFVAECSVGFY